jgi:DNA-binding protein H-NS
MDVTQLSALLKLGAEGVLFVSMAIAIKYLWEAMAEKDKQIIDERNKREELIVESIKASNATFETAERILEILQRLENGALLNARNRN